MLCPKCSAGMMEGVVYENGMPTFYTVEEVKGKVIWPKGRPVGEMADRAVYGLGGKFIKSFRCDICPLVVIPG